MKGDINDTDRPESTNQIDGLKDLRYHLFSLLGETYTHSSCVGEERDYGGNHIVLDIQFQD